jgi:hypothetical protein
MLLPLFFPSEMIILGMGDFLGPEEMNDACRKMMHKEKMDRGFTIQVSQ